MSAASRIRQLARDGHNFGIVPTPRIHFHRGPGGVILGAEGIPQEMTPERRAWILNQNPEWRRDDLARQWLGLDKPKTIRARRPA